MITDITEVWALLAPGGFFVPPIDSEPGDMFIAFQNEASARAGAAIQAQWYEGVEPTPVLLFQRTTSRG